MLDRIYTDLRHMSSWEGDGAIPVDMKKLNGIWAQKHLLALRVYFELFSASSFIGYTATLRSLSFTFYSSALADMTSK